MKLQYLGDWRDAFKWDLLHWLCAAGAEMTSLLFVPLLTPDDLNPRDGQVPHDRFVARPEVQRFVAGLKGNPRGLRAITDLGTLTPATTFSVSIHAPDRHVATGRARPEYWHGIDYPSNSIAFLDPDNGFETKTQKGTKWVRHDEVGSLLAKLPRSSALVVYQHRPRRTWDDVLGDLSQSLRYAGHASATYDSGLAFIIMGRRGSVARRLSDSAMRYAEQHPTVSHKRLVDSGA
jgi:hypothetical protein